MFNQSLTLYWFNVQTVEQTMEAHAQSVEDNLIDSLSFKLRAGASYVTDRRSVTFFPLGGNHYTSNGVGVIKISLNGDQWLDPSTVKLFYTIQNTTTLTIESDLIPLITRPWGFFQAHESNLWWTNYRRYRQLQSHS